DKAKEALEKRGGTEGLKAEAAELRKIAAGDGSLAEKAKEAAAKLKEPKQHAPDTPAAAPDTRAAAPDTPAAAPDTPGTTPPGRSAVARQLPGRRLGWRAAARRPCPERRQRRDQAANPGRHRRLGPGGSAGADRGLRRPEHAAARASDRRGLDLRARFPRPAA